MTTNNSNTPLETIDIADFKFLNEDGSIHSFIDQKKKAFFTWNEDCVPCKKLIKELSPSFNHPEVDYYLIYVPFRNSKFNPKDLDQFLPAKNKVIILNDAEQQIKHKLNVGSTPLILLLNEDKIHYSTIGYSSKKKEEILRNLNNL